MDLRALETMFRAGKITCQEVLVHTPLDKLDEALTVLKRYRVKQEICSALTERISKASLDDFQVLKHIYYRHF